MLQQSTYVSRIPCIYRRSDAIITASATSGLRPTSVVVAGHALASIAPHGCHPGTLYGLISSPM